MLVLTRKQQEKIQIGDDITITILKTKGKTVRIGIEAPNTVPVLRGELATKIKAEMQSLASGNQTEESAEELAPEPDTESGSGANNAANNDCTEVTHQRVARSRVATILPQMLGDGILDEVGPLRAMLDRRAGVSV